MSPIQKEPLLTHDRNLLIGKIFAVTAIILIIIESIFTYFSIPMNIGMQLGSFAINFISVILLIFILFILRYYLLNFGMDKTRIAVMTLIILLIIEFAYSKLSTVMLFFIGRMYGVESYATSAIIHSVFVIITLAAYLVVGIMLIVNRNDFVGGLRILGATFVLKVAAFGAFTFLRIRTTDEYVANQESGGKGLMGLIDSLPGPEVIQYIFNMFNILGNIPNILILLAFIYVLARAKKHTLCWQDPI